jgi:hypothetical protein
VFTDIVWCHSENNAPDHLENVTFVKGVQDFENPDNKPGSMTPPSSCVYILWPGAIGKGFVYKQPPSWKGSGYFQNNIAYWDN